MHAAVGLYVLSRVFPQLILWSTPTAETASILKVLKVTNLPISTTSEPKPIKNSGVVPFLFSPDISAWFIRYMPVALQFMDLPEPPRERALLQLGDCC
jgi:hypothetical protein